MIRSRLLAPALLALAQSPAQSPAPAPGVATPPPPLGPSATDEAPAAPPLAPWEGSVAEGFARLRAEAEAGRHESARTIADRLLAPNAFLRWKTRFTSTPGWKARALAAVEPAIDWLRLDGLDDNTRAEVWYARGVASSLALARSDAQSDFEHARAQALDRGLRHDAMYDLGVLALEAGEEARATIPEISRKPPAPPPSAPVAGAAEPPDPLQVARTAYLEARDRFVERLRSDWHDLDTQKNVELCLRRLRELDEIERQREEEKQKQKQEQEQNQDEKQKQDQKPDQQKQDKQDKQDGDPQQDPNQAKPEEGKPEDEKPEPKPEDKQPEPEKKDDAAQDADKKPAPKPDSAEAQMSREEMTQLLDRLQQLEEEAKKIQAQLRAARRGKVKKDW